MQGPAQPPAGAAVDEPQLGVTGQEGGVERRVDALEGLLHEQPVQVHLGGCRSRRGRLLTRGSRRPAARRR